MFRNLLGAALVAAVLASPALADPWKDESGHGRGGGDWGKYKNEWKGDFGGETPWWGRGKGYWDGFYKQDRPQPYVQPWGGSYRYPGYYPGYPSRYYNAPTYYDPPSYFRYEFRIDPGYGVPPPPVPYRYDAWNY